MYIHDIRLYKVFTYRKSSIKPAPPPPPRRGVIETTAGGLFIWYQFSIKN